MRHTYIFIFCCFIFGVTPALRGANTSSLKELKLTVIDANTKEALPGAHIVISCLQLRRSLVKVTDFKGRASFSLDKGKYQLKVSYIGYSTYQKEIQVHNDTSLAVKLQESERLIHEVVVTAKESTGKTSSSRIGREAMKHLQPSSFTDLLELLPGGFSQDPELTTSNYIRIREAGTSESSSNALSSLGTAFVIDGAPVLGDANMQTIRQGSSFLENRSNASKGVDMRTISTDNIQSVEVVRGIPSAQYGDLTNGVVKIKRKEGASQLQARFKADQFSKMVYAGKGFLLPNSFVMNASLNFLDAKSDPRNTFLNYKRYTSALRLSRKHETADDIFYWGLTADYTGSFDEQKFDPDVNEKKDTYKSSYNRYSLGHLLRYTKRKKSIFKELSLNLNASLQMDRLKQTTEVYMNTPSIVPNSKVEGEHDGTILPNQYLSHLEIDGLPFTFFSQLNSKWNIQTGGLFHHLLVGGEYRYQKNYGEGQIYDVDLPPSKLMTGRPRAFKDIPSQQKIIFFAEDGMSYRSGVHHLSLNAGLRSGHLLGLDKNFALSGKWYVDPRLNGKWEVSLPNVGGKVLTLGIGGGWGINTKTPTILQLYPERYFVDLEQLNYYHKNSDYRRINLKTFIFDKTNDQLEAARNTKWELRFNASWDSNHLSVTYFKEHCDNGFGTKRIPLSMAYRRYDASAIDPNTIQHAPVIEDLPYTEEKYVSAYGQLQNIGIIKKEGVEFQFSTKRFQSFATRFTINGGYFKTILSHQGDLTYNPDVVLDGKTYPYTGIYKNKEGSIRRRFSTRLMSDTYVKKLGLLFSTSLQCTWFTDYETFPPKTVPYAYYDENLKIHSFDPNNLADPRLSHLVKRSSVINKSNVPFAGIINFKASKEFGKHINLSLFVNRIIDYLPDYERNGIVLKRSSTPYFGMEMNIKI